MTGTESDVSGATTRKMSSADTLQRAINELFDDFLRREREPSAFLPALDIEESDSEILVSAELPGVEASDVEVSVERDRLVIKGEKKSEKESRRGAARCLERCYGSFRRSIPLPAEVDADKASAELKHGVLKIKLPRAPGAAKTRKVAISS